MLRSALDCRARVVAFAKCAGSGGWGLSGLSPKGDALKKLVPLASPDTRIPIQERMNLQNRAGKAGLEVRFCFCSNVGGRPKHPGRGIGRAGTQLLKQQLPRPISHDPPF